MSAPSAASSSCRRTDTFAHGMKIGPGYISGLMVQWQGGNPVTVWPANVATGKLKFPAFIKIGG